MNGGNAGRKGMRTNMSSNPETPKIGIRNWKLASVESNFQFQVSSSALKLTFLLAVVLGLSAWPGSCYGSQRVWEKSFELPPGSHVSVVNVHGSVLVQGWDRDEVEATVAMRSEAATDQLDDVQVAVEARSHAVSFHTLYPAGLDTPIRVDYRLRVPRQVWLDELSTLDGEIVIHDVAGSIQARNLHGDIAGINVSGSVVAHALTGNIMMSLRSLPERHEPFTLATINGNVDLVLPAQANANLELSTVAGNIAGEYPYRVSSVPGDSTRHAVVGAGGVRMELTTVRGNIRVGQNDDDL
jgi:hypothetical protein